MRRPPLAALGNETRCRVEDTVVIAGRSEDTIHHRLCKCPLLFMEIAVCPSDQPHQSLRRSTCRTTWIGLCSLSWTTISAIHTRWPADAGMV